MEEKANIPNQPWFVEFSRNFLTRTVVREQRTENRPAKAMASLPPLHSDPFDRLLIAQAMSEPLHLITTDERLKPYSELVVLV
jgi:PIN domain nuclease of toxin-antitoxin system